MIFIYDFFQRSTEITNQRTADTSGVHFTDFNSCFFQETTVNTDLTKFILDQYDLFVCISLFQKFFDQCSFTGSKETGDNINLCCHDSCSPFFCIFLRKSACSLNCGSGCKKFLLRQEGDMTQYHAPTCFLS